MSNNFSYILERLTARAQAALISAQRLSEKFKHNHTGSEHLLYGIVAEKNAFGGEILIKNNVRAENIKETIRSRNAESAVSIWQANISENFRLSLEKAAIVASRHNYAYIATEHLLFGLLDCENALGHKILTDFGLDAAKLKKELLAIFEHSAKFPDFLGIEEQMSLNSATRAKTLPEEKISKSPALDYFTTDLTERARSGKIDPVIGRAVEIERVMAILNRRHKNNPVLIGEPGVGKTAIVEGLALAITKGEVPESLRDRKILALDLALVVAGSMFRGEFENRLKQVIDELAEDENIILFIDELHTLVGAGATTGSLDAANILKPALARGEVRAIGATTLNEYKKYIENDAALERRFQPILVEEPSAHEAIQIIEGILANYEKYHDVRIAPEAVTAAVELSVRYLPDRFLPDKALDLIDETAANLKTKHEHSPKVRLLKALEEELYEIAKEKTQAVLVHDFDTAKALRHQEEILRAQHKNYGEDKHGSTRVTIGHEDIARTVSQITKIPLGSLVQTEIDKLAALEKSLKTRVVGQDEVTAAVADAIRRSRLGLSSPRRPLGSFIFMGPSGVGKTEMAKVLAEEVYQNRNALIRVDMSEFMEKHNVARLIGAPAGYVGFEEGELTDAAGRKVNFKNTTCIMTSNVGLAELNREAARFGFVGKEELPEAKERYEQAKERVLESLKEIMRPELINRIDKVLVFKPLEFGHIKEIVALQLREMQTRLQNRNIDLNWDAKAVGWLANHSVSAEEGARLVRRNLQENVEAKIAETLLRDRRFQNLTAPIKVKITTAKNKIDIKFQMPKRPKNWSSPLN